MEDSIYRISWMSVCSTTACSCPRRDWCLWKPYLKDNPPCYLLCQVNKFTVFYFSSQKGAKLTKWICASSSKLQSHWNIENWKRPTHWWSKSHLRQFWEMPEKLPSFWETKADGKLLKWLKYVALLQHLCGSWKKSALIDFLLPMS